MSSMDPAYESLKELLAKTKKVLLVSHKGPDGDTASANLALALALEQNGTPSVSFCKDPYPESLRFLPAIQRFTQDPAVFNDPTFDAIMVLDSGDLEYAGISDFIHKDVLSRPTLINIDHHITNVFFGDVNVVDSAAVSTTHVLYHLFSAMQLTLTPDIATCLLTGIVTDTGNFSNLATTHESLRVASELVKKGGRMATILSHTKHNKTLSSLKLWGRVFSRLKMDPETGRVTTVVYKKDYEECGVDQESGEGISNFLNVLGDVHSILVLKDMGDGFVRGSLRTTRQGVDVGKVALQYGGGGHTKAAGFQIKGVIKEEENQWTFIPTVV